MNLLKKRLKYLFFPCQARIDNLWNDLNKACNELENEIGNCKHITLKLQYNKRRK